MVIGSGCGKRKRHVVDRKQVEGSTNEQTEADIRLRTIYGNLGNRYHSQNGTGVGFFLGSLSNTVKLSLKDSRFTPILQRTLR